MARSLNYHQSPTPPPPASIRMLDMLHRFALRRLDREDLVEPRDAEQFEQFRADAAQDEFAVLQPAELLVEREDDADRLAGEVLDLLEIEHESAAVFVVDEAVKLGADRFEDDRVHERRRAELDDGELFERV